MKQKRKYKQHLIDYYIIFFCAFQWPMFSPQAEQLTETHTQNMHVFTMRMSISITI